MEDPEGGRDRGFRHLLRAWVEVLVHPRRFFSNGVGPGDQAPGLTFAVVVAFAFALGWLLADPGVLSDPDALPPIADSDLLTAVVVLLAVVTLAAPVGLHLTAAVATLSLLVACVELRGGFSLRERAGVSETVQVVAYASAPMALAGPPVAGLRVVCAGYATVLLLVGLHTVHRTTLLRTLVAGVPPAVVGYWVAYRNVGAVRTLLGG